MDVIRLARTLIDIPSVTGAEGPAVDFAAAWLEEAGFHVIRQDVTPGRANLFASAGEPAGVVLCSHLDTVLLRFPAPRMRPMSAAGAPATPRARSRR